MDFAIFGKLPKKTELPEKFELPGQRGFKMERKSPAPPRQPPLINGA